ncbi:hypothetical protein KR009_009268, partial [Drosophila setifemur]
AANILGVFPYRVAGPFKVVRPLVRALTERGHNITIITPEGMLDDIEGVRHMRVPGFNQIVEELSKGNLDVDLFANKWSEGVLLAKIVYNISHAALSDEGVQRLMRDKTERFDMVILETGYMDALHGLAEYYNAILMGLSSMCTDWYTEYLAGNFAPSVYDPISPAGFAHDGSLLSMFHNWIYISEEILLNRLLIRPTQLRVFKKFFGYSTQKFNDLRDRISVILVNNHFTMGRARANVPNMIEVGGLHLTEPTEPCGKELLRFLDEAEHGVIYFSMGQDIMFNYLPDNVKQPLLQSFANLKQRVVWKTDLFSMRNNSESIFGIANAPQRELLTHPNVKLFITHGGLLSVMEAVSSGVPMLGIPLFFDQFTNMHRVEMVGAAKVLDSNTLTVQSVTSTIRELIENPKYSARAKEMSRSFKDRPKSPLETAVWWTEYALRHRDVSHFRLNKEDIPLMQYYCLDSMITLVLRFGFLAGIVILLSYKLISKYRDRRRRLRERKRVFR